MTEDCLVSFGGERYSEPFRLLGRVVEVRGCAGRGEIHHEATVVAVHSRGCS